METQNRSIQISLLSDPLVCTELTILLISTQMPLNAVEVVSDKDVWVSGVFLGEVWVVRGPARNTHQRGVHKFSPTSHVQLETKIFLE